MRSKSIYLNGQRWVVHFRNHPVIADGDDCLGVCDGEKREIEIKVKGCTAEVRRITLLHEIMHACVWAAGDRWQKEEEDGIRNLQSPLYSLFSDKRNSWVVNYLRRS